MLRPVLFLLAALAPALCAVSATQSTDFGCTPYATATSTGATFRVWAGTATSVSVAGSFNGWSQSANPLESEGDGVWAADVEGAKPGDTYKFVLNGPYATDLWKKDPRAVSVESSSTSEANAIVYDHGAFDWDGAEKVVGGTEGNDCIWRNDLVIYELNVGNFASEGKNGAAGNFYDATNFIPYLADLGVSAVQIMPCAEFPGDFSLGYNPADPFAIESIYGGPDGLKTFVKCAHEHGLAVILDIVHNHYGPTDLTVWAFDGKSASSDTGGMYFYEDARAITDWGHTRPDFGNEQVRSFIHDNAIGLVENFHVDGFRWDSVWNIAWYHWDGSAGGDWWNDDGATLLDEINTEIASDYPDFFRFAEDNAFDGNMNFEADGDMTFRDDIHAMATDSEDANRNMSTLAYHLTDGSLEQIVHAESHDTCNAGNGQHRLPRAIHGDEPQGYWATKRAFLANAVTLVSPAIPMIFAGSEYNEDYDFAAETPLRWSDLAAANAGLVSAHRDLIRLRRNLDGNSPGFRDVSNASCTLCDDTKKVVAVSRGDGLVLVVNFSATAQTGYAVPFPATGTWHCLFNSDETRYSSLFGDVGPARFDTLEVTGSSAKTDIGAYTLQVWGTVSGTGTVLFDPAAPAEGDLVAITYDAGDGPLANASAVTAHLGENGWSPTTNLTMTAVEGTNGVWVLEYAITSGVTRLDVCFTDGDVWDSNGGTNWSVEVASTSVVSLAILEPGGDGERVVSTVSPVSFAGTASLLSSVVWSNEATGAGGTLAVADGAWDAGEIELAEGTNLLSVAAGNPNDGAGDDMESEIGDGNNGGSGFGAWEVSATDNAGCWTDTENGWGFFANEGGFVEAARPFASTLQPGDTVSFVWRHGNIDSGGSVGFGFVDAAGKTAVEYYFPGGESAYVLAASATNRAAGNWTDQEQPVVFALGEDGAYTLAVGTNAFSGTLATGDIAKVRMWNYKAGSGSASDEYWKGLAVEGEALLAGGPSASVEVVFSASGIEEVTASVPVATGTGGVFRVTTDASDSSVLTGNVFLATNLESGAWAWREATADECEIVEGGAILVPPADAPLALYSLGRPR